MGKFFEKTVAGIGSLLLQVIFTQEVAQKKGYLQSLDPRVKVISLIILLLTVNLVHQFLSLVLIYVFILFLAVVSSVPMVFFLKRVWLFLPFFTGIIVLPLIFNIVTPGTTLLELVNLPAFHINLSITVPGLLTAFNIIFRVAVSVSLVVLVILSTPWYDLLKSLQVLFVPQVFVVILGMTYRYIFVLLQTVNNMFLSRKSRLVGRVSGRENRKWLASLIGTLFAKSFVQSEEIYLSMQSRGYRNKIVTLDSFQLESHDLLFLSGCLILCVNIILFIK